MSYWDPYIGIGSVVTGIGAVATAFSILYLRKTFNFTKKSEEIKYTHEINNRLRDANQLVQEAIGAGRDPKLRYLAKLEVWDSYAFLVRNNIIQDEEIRKFYRARMDDGYGILNDYPEAIKDVKYENFVELCKEYRIDKNNILSG